LAQASAAQEPPAELSCRHTATMELSSIAAPIVRRDRSLARERALRRQGSLVAGIVDGKTFLTKMPSTEARSRRSSVSSHSTSCGRQSSPYSPTSSHSDACDSLDLLMFGAVPSDAVDALSNSCALKLQPGQGALSAGSLLNGNDGTVAHEHVQKEPKEQTQPNRSSIETNTLGAKRGATDQSAMLQDTSLSFKATSTSVGCRERTDRSERGWCPPRVAAEHATTRVGRSRVRIAEGQDHGEGSLKRKGTGYINFGGLRSLSPASSR